MTFAAQALGGNLGKEINSLLNQLNQLQSAGSQGCSGQDGQQDQKEFDKILKELQHAIQKMESKDQSGANGGT
jgi:hypothetical protein